MTKTEVVELLDEYYAKAMENHMDTDDEVEKRETLGLLTGLASALILVRTMK